MRDSRMVMPPPTMSKSGVAGSSQMPGQSATGFRMTVIPRGSIASKAVSKSASYPACRANPGESGLASSLWLTGAKNA